MARNADHDKKAGPAGRDERLKAALRENLRRRKAQARGRDAAEKPEVPQAGRSGEDER